jgi:ABC-type branched-subunit amino acid transport system substrate-binding protein
VSTRSGGLAPLSAPGSVVGGEAMRDAMLLAERDVNAAGGVLGCDLEGGHYRYRRAA